MIRIAGMIGLLGVKWAAYCGSWPPQQLRDPSVAVSFAAVFCVSADAVFRISDAALFEVSGVGPQQQPSCFWPCVLDGAFEVGHMFISSIRNLPLYCKDARGGPTLQQTGYSDF